METFINVSKVCQALPARPKLAIPEEKNGNHQRWVLFRAFDQPCGSFRCSADASTARGTIASNDLVCRAEPCCYAPQFILQIVSDQDKTQRHVPCARM